MNKSFLKLANLLSFVNPNWLGRLTGQQVLLPFYHAVSDQVPLHLKHLYPVKSLAAFQRDLEDMLKHYQPITLQEFRQHITGERPINKPSFLLSFDDGLSEFGEVVAPVLLSKGIPAVNFLNSAFVDNKDLFYRYKASILINDLIQKPEYAQQLKGITGRSTHSQQLGFIQSVNYQNRQVLDQIAQVFGRDFGAYLTLQKPYLSSLQIKELQHQGFDFGAHSIDHPKYHQLSLQEQLLQTRESLDWVGGLLGKSEVPFAFPFTDYGVSSAFFGQIEQLPQYFCSFGTAGLKQDTAVLNFQRIPMEVTHSPASQVILAEYFYYLVKSLLNKNKIKRN